MTTVGIRRWSGKRIGKRIEMPIGDKPGMRMVIIDAIDRDRGFWCDTRFRSDGKIRLRVNRVGNWISEGVGSGVDIQAAGTKLNISAWQGKGQRNQGGEKRDEMHGDFSVWMRQVAELQTKEAGGKR